MLGMVTTLMMHFPVGSLIDAVFFILKGYQLDGPPRRFETRNALMAAKNVTTYLLSDLFMRVVWLVVWLIVKLRKDRAESSTPYVGIPHSLTKA
jgi:hypothetical protein